MSKSSSKRNPEPVPAQNLSLELRSHARFHLRIACSGRSLPHSLDLLIMQARRSTTYPQEQAPLASAFASSRRRPCEARLDWFKRRICTLLKPRHPPPFGSSTARRHKTDCDGGGMNPQSCSSGHPLSYRPLINLRLLFLAKSRKRRDRQPLRAKSTASFPRPAYSTSSISPTFNT